MLVTPEEMQALEDAVFASGRATPEELMDEAALGIAGAILQLCPSTGTAVVFAAKGHNGGDAIATARHLASAGWQIDLRLTAPRADLKPLTLRKLEQFDEFERLAPTPPPQAPHGRPTIILDGLLGIGASGPLRDDYRAQARAINALRDRRTARTFAIDIPTGVDGDTGEVDPDAVMADFTLTIGRVKRGLVADTATSHVGRIALIPLGDLTPEPEGDRAGADAFAITPHSLLYRLWHRPFDCHKGDAGRIGIVAGSRGFIGAAVLCAAAAVRGGGGLVTLFVPDDQTYPVAAGSVPPEAMVQPLGRLHEVLDRNLDVLAIGPGIGAGRDADITELIEKFGGPLILDADALNLLARRGLVPLERRDAAGFGTLLTPHPGEMRRLLGGAAVGDRAGCAREFAARFQRLTLLLKGARTVVSSPGGKTVAFNTAATPGMASGGMGDTLTGLCAALAAVQPDLFGTACLAAWIHARSAELALSHGGQSEESLVASDVIDHLGGAMDAYRQGAY
ncbi:bifunctional ADP-dependent NAD(P)H-hydrate dehydratase/NAD(P)H-hydrate epimerase [soil metagenome]